jgi:hypothetical protein
MEYSKPTQGVMINIPEDIKQFLGTDESPMANEYANTYVEIAHVVEKLSKIEEIILQKRCMKDENLNIKLSILRDYIYARTPFYRRNKSTKDIRVIVSRIDLIYPNKIPTLDELYMDSEFMDKAKTKLIDSMSEEHKQTCINYHGCMTEIENF